MRCVLTCRNVFIAKCGDVCSEYPANIAVAAAIRQGIVVVVAAGNGAADSCQISPASGKDIHISYYYCA
jgi:hypothetical protein